MGGLLFVFGVTELQIGSGRVAGHMPLQITVMALCTLPILLRQWQPVATFLVVTVAFGGKYLVMRPMSQPLSEVLGLGVVLYTIGVRCSNRVAVPLLLVYGVAAHLRTLGTPDTGPAGEVVDFLFGLLVFGIGRLVRHLDLRATQSEERVAVVETWAAESSREAVQEERLRIARELHDIVAHDIGVVLLHAGGGRRMLDHDVEQSRQAFATIESAAGDALTETRRLLGVLRADHDELTTHPPTVSDLPALAERVRASGAHVDLRVGDLGEVSTGLGLCVYRIVQEACTNAVRHGRATRIVVRVQEGVDGLELEVTDDGTPGPPSPHGGGHGLVGMRERVALYDGTLRLGPRPEGGFGVLAVLPRGRP